jgi:hypothetical protein
METKSQLWNLACNRFRLARSLGSRTCSKGQAAVEFTLCFVLLLVIAWIPADFGLAFYTGQQALNASREGARIAAADRNLLAQVGTCTMPCGSAPAGSLLAVTAGRLSSALLPGAQISITYDVPPGPVCNKQIRVQVSGDYHFFFYQILRLFAGNAAVSSNSANIVHSTAMRWEHQDPCFIGS